MISLPKRTAFTCLLTSCLMAGQWLAAPSANATEAPPPQGVVSLMSSATVEVTKDLLTVTLSTAREGPDAGSVGEISRQRFRKSRDMRHFVFQQLLVRAIDVAHHNGEVLEP